jgi:hypothetical protein
MEDPNLLTSKNRRNVVTITEIHDRFIVHDVIADELTICELPSELEETINDIFFPHRITTQE